MKFNVTIDRDEDGVWIVECPSIPGCVSQGETKDQALANIQDAIIACLQVRRDFFTVRRDSSGYMPPFTLNLWNRR